MAVQDQFVARKGLISLGDVFVTSSVTAKSFTGSFYGTSSYSSQSLLSLIAISTEFANVAGFALTSNTASLALTASSLNFVPRTSLSSSWSSQSLSSSVSVAADTASYIGAGTNNYIPKWNNNTLTSTSNLYDSGTNIGIGKSSPTVKLDVSSSTGVIAKFATADSTAAIVDLESTSNKDSVIRMYQLLGANGWTLGLDNSSSTKNFTIASGIVPLSSAASSSKFLVITNSGSVGIGTISPSEKLHVQGNISASNITASRLLGTASWADNSGQLGGQNPSYYLDLTNTTGILPTGRLTGSYSITSSWSVNTVNAASSATSSYFDKLWVISGSVNVPQIVGHAIDLGSFNINDGAHSLRVSIVVPSTGFSVAKEYLITSLYNGTNNSWYIVPPVSNSGPYSNQDFDLDINQNNNLLNLRLRRTSGATVGVATYRIEYLGNYTANYNTGSTTSSSVSVPSITYSNLFAHTSSYAVNSATSSYVLSSNIIGVVASASNASTLAGNGPSYYLDLTNSTGILPVGRLSGTYNITSSWANNTVTALTSSFPSPLYIQSRLENLVTNGSGLMGNNYNFSGFIFQSTDLHGGGGSFYYSGSSSSKFNDELIPVDPEKFYKLSGWGKSGEIPPYSGSVVPDPLYYTSSARQYLGVACFDIDGNVISPTNTMRYPGATDTYLQKTLNVGDTSFIIQDSSGWNNNNSAIYGRHFIWYGYTNSKGYTYPPFTYTRYISVSYGIGYSTNGTWAVGAITSSASGSIVNLTAPWNGPVLPSGSAIRNAYSGGSYKYITTAVNTAVPTVWTKYEGYIGGLDLDFNNASNRFHIGTAYIRLLFLLNYPDATTTNNKISWSDLWFSEMTTYNFESATPTIPGIVTTGSQQWYGFKGITGSIQGTSSYLYHPTNASVDSLAGGLITIGSACSNINIGTGTGNAVINFGTGAGNDTINIFNLGSGNNILNLGAITSSTTSINLSGSVKFSGSFIPGITNRFDLGSSTNRFSTIYANSFPGTSSYASASTTATNVINPNPGTGTNNYLPKWSSNTLTATSNVYDDGSNIGIGTTNPIGNVHVAGGVNYVFELHGPNLSSSQINATNWSYGGIDIFDSGSALTSTHLSLGGNRGLLNYQVGVLGFHSINNLNEALSSSVGAFISAVADDSLTTTRGLHLVFGTRSGSTPVSEKMRLTDDGKLGVGISSPQEKLHVQGNIIATSVISNLTGTASWANNSLTSSYINASNVNGVVTSASNASNLAGNGPSYYLNLSNSTGTLPVARLSGTYNITSSWTNNALSARSSSWASSSVSASTVYHPTNVVIDSTSSGVVTIGNICNNINIGTGTGNAVINFGTGAGNDTINVLSLGVGTNTFNLGAITSSTTLLNISGSVKFSGSFIPGVTNRFDLGSSTNRFLNVYSNNFVGTASVATTTVNPNPGTGTNNYLPKWNSNTLTATSLIYDDGTDVGFGTTNPLGRIHGADGVNYIFELHGPSLVASQIDSLNWSYGGVNVFDSGSSVCSSHISLGGNRGIQNYQVGIIGFHSLNRNSETLSSSVGAYISAVADDNLTTSRGLHLVFGTRSGSIPVSEKMRLTDTGNLGIGIGSPQEKLHVQGNIIANTVIADLTGTASWASNTLTSSYVLASNVSGVVTSASNASNLAGNGPSYYLNLSNSTGTLPVARLSGTYNITSSWSNNALSAKSSSWASSSLTSSTVYHSVNSVIDSTSGGLITIGSVCSNINIGTGTGNAVINFGTGAGNDIINVLNLGVGTNTFNLGAITSSTTLLNISGSVKFSGSFIPGVTNRFDLGSSTNRFSSVYANNFVGTSSVATTIAGYNVGGNVWPMVPFVGIDGVIEVGKYIDFHETSNDGIDYVNRIESNGTGSLLLNGSKNWGITSSWATNAVNSTTALNVTNPNPGTGTNNYIPKWNSNQLTGTSLIYDDGTNVGFGTTNPIGKIHGVGIGYVFEINGPTLTSAQVNPINWSYGGIDIFESGSSTTSTHVALGGNRGLQNYQVGVLGFHSLNRNTEALSSSVGAFISAVADDSLQTSRGLHLVFGTRSGSIPISEKMRLTDEGDLGIGTSNPQSKLDVQGTITATSVISNLTGTASWATNAVSVSTPNPGTGTNNYIPKWNSNQLTGTSLIYDDGTGVGINGVISPIGTLHVYGGALDGTLGRTLTGSVIQFSTPNGSYLKTFVRRTSSQNVWESAAVRIQMFTDVTPQGYIEFNPTGSPYGLAFGVRTGVETEVFRIHNDGFVGIGTSSPSAKLHVNGAVSASSFGTGSLYGTSSWASNTLSSSYATTALNVINANPGTGTNNYVPKWSSNTLTATSLIYDDGSKIGFGTTNPLGRIHAAGSATYAFEINNPAINATQFDSTNWTYGGLNVFESSSAVSNTHIAVGGNRGIQNYHVGLIGFHSLNKNSEALSSSIGAYISAIADDSLTTTRGLHLNFCTRSGSTNISEKMRITDVGYVGIGTTAPKTTLQVGSDYNGASIWTGSHAVVKIGVGVGSSGSIVEGIHIDCNPDTSYDKGVAISIGQKNSVFGQYTSRIVHYGYGNSTLGSRLQLQTHTGTSNVWNVGLTINETGDVGVGTTNPSGKFEVIGTTNQRSTVIGDAGFGTTYAGLSVQGSLTTSNYSLLGNGTDLYINRPSGGAMYFRAGNSDQMHIHTDGNVGIGRTVAGFKLDVSQSFSSGLRVVTSDKTYGNLVDFQTLGDKDVAIRVYKSDASTGWMVGMDGSNNNAFSVTAGVGSFNIASTSSKYFNILQNGNVGIGTITPENSAGWEKVVQISASNHSRFIVSTSDIRTVYATHDSGYYSSPAGALLGTETNHGLTIITNSGPRVTITNGGSVGIGKTDPTSKLHIEGTYTTTGSTFNSDLSFGTATNPIWGFRVGGSPYSLLLNTEPAGGGGSTVMTWTRTGLVGIGTGSAAVKLDVSGSVRVTGITTPSSGYGMEMHYVGGATPYGTIYAYDRDSSQYKHLILGTNGNQLYLSSTGNVGIGAAADASYKLYIAGDTYLNGEIRFGGTTDGSVASNGRSFYTWMRINIGGSNKWIPIYN